MARSSAYAGGGTIGADGGTIVQRGRFGKRLLAELGYRSVLADGIQPAVYPWPLALEARPL